jgi:hypothetical protein
MIKALQNVDPERILFFDIEVATLEDGLTEDSPFYEAWSYKCRNSKEFEKKNFNEDILQSYNEKGSLYAEFAKVVTISIGRVNISEGIITVKSFYKGCEEGIETEADIINGFYKLLDAFKSKYGKIYLCGHAIKTYDIPTIFKRSLILGILPHDLVDTSNTKPWLLDWLIDTLELFKGDSYSPSSLLALTAAFGLESPKQDIQGHETTQTYYNGEVERIAKYCERDVVAVANVLLKMMQRDVVEKKLSELDFADVPLLEKVAKLGKYTKEEAVKVVGIYDVLEENEKPIAEKLIEISFKKSLEELRNLK